MIQHAEEAVKFLIAYMRSPEYRRLVEYSDYGYDVYVPNVMRAYVVSQEKVNFHEADRFLYQHEISHHFYNAAWELCRRGILRPGVATWRAQSTDDGSAGNGYAVTLFGRQWLSEGGHDDFVVTEPERFGEMIGPFRARYGEAFHERAQEAIRCYGAHAYLACCVMCGAATESIMLAVACTIKPEEEVMKTYGSAMGRSRIEQMILGQARERLRQEFLGYLSLLKYWRDTAGHGRAALISDNEAYTSIAMLLRFALYVDEYWDELTKGSIAPVP